MATLSPPTITTTTTTHTPFLPKSPRLFSFKKSPHTLRSACTKVACKASNNNNDDEFQLIQNPNNNTPLQFDRRNMLIGLGGMYGAATTLGGGAADTLASPIAPDIKACTLTSAEFDKSVGDRCCPPAIGLREIKEFQFEDKPVMRVRRPAHLAMQDEKWLADYKRGIALMKSLPLSDPRNFMQQARVHCAYCDGAYPVLENSDKRYEVHGSWLFAPFHRWYLYFFEKILGKLIDNPEFALPYWNWDHPDGMRIPDMFKDKDSPIYDPNRSKLHQTKVIDLSYNKQEHEYTDEKQIEQNLLLMRKQMLYPTKPSVFFGDAYRAGDKADINKGAGALELSPHNAVHSWTGSESVWAGQDMGAFWSAGRDPIFYCHHANVDRLWTVWRNDLPGRSRLDINDQDYLNAYFILYDEDANPVKVYVKDSFDTEKLGYKYQPQDLPWLTKTVTPPIRPTKPPTPGPIVNFPKPLDSVIKTSVKRPKKSRTKAEVEAAEEVLVISMDVAMSTQNIKYDVFINEVSDPKPGDKTDVKPQFAGSFTSMGHRGSGDGMADMTRKTEYKVALSKLLDDIGAANDEYIQVTIVPKVGAKAIVINDIKIELVSF